MGRRVQLPLPGELAPRPRRPRPPRWRSHARVWSDPAVLQAEADAGHLFEDWRGSFVRLLRGLPKSRRAELRARLGDRPSQRRGLRQAA